MLKICRVGLYIELVYAIIPTSFHVFLLFCYPYILLMLFMSIFVNSRCMLELKFAIYHRATKKSVGLTDFLSKCMQED